MSDSARVHGKLSAANVMEFYDRSTYERVDVLTNIAFKDDFIGAGGGTIPAAGSPVDGFPWVKKLVDTSGSPTVGGVANAGGGQVQLLIDTTSEKQEATLYGNDSLWADVTKGLIFEARVKMTTLPSATGVEAVWGVSSAWIDGPDNASEYVEFGLSGTSALANLRSQDGTTQNSVASAFTVDTNFHVYRFDCYAPSAILFYIDGVLQNEATTIGFAATGASAILQPYLSCYKPSGAGHAVMVVDYVRAWMTSRES
jgi:hypothetical protein